jgi:site-specific DNA-methyltransferase (adenine-specific)
MTKIHYTDGPLTLWHGRSELVLRELEDNSIDAVITDPPYELGFMGKGWDSTGIAYSVELWTEVFRVMKPGAHLLAFGASRTWHRLAVAIEDSGFQIRDGIMWIYGTGFPKSLDVSDAMEKWKAGERPVAASLDSLYAVTGFLKAARDKAGWTNKRIDAKFGTNGMAGHWTSLASQPAVPSVRQWAELKTALGFGDELDALVAELGSNERPEDWGEGEGNAGQFLASLAADPNAEKAGAWGTALKPGFEPIVVARKPLVGTVAANIAMYGTGALNLEATRTKGVKVVEGDRGRWPLNVVVDEIQAAEINRQSKGAASIFPKFDHDAELLQFPLFRYESKAPTKERPTVDDVQHATVKPLALMRWLARLITPPGGRVLDLFAGSGTTGEACLVEGFDCTLIEMEAVHLPLIMKRMRKPLQQSLFADFEEAA